MIRLRTTTLVVAIAISFGACTERVELIGPESAEPSFARSQSGPELTGRYLLMSRSWALPPNLGAQVRAAGGELVATMPAIGAAVAVPKAPNFALRAARIGGIASVTPDFVINRQEPGGMRAVEVLTADVDASPRAVPGTDATPFDHGFFFSFQWAPVAIQAPQAWTAGFTGQGVRVAILDSGLFDQHLDLAPNVDVAASRSFVPGFAFNEETGTFWHGTHVAGIVASSGLIGTAGIAPRATLIGVKVFHDEVTTFEWIINGILYAATPRALGGAGADIINMSFGATFDFRSDWKDKEWRDAVRALTMVLDRAMRYADQQGVTLISSTGNEAINFDVSREIMSVPTQSQHVLGVSATGPHGWALGATDFERPAYYTNLGKDVVAVAAPGGTIGLFVVDGVDQICTVTGEFTSITTFCEIFDLVLSTVRGTTVASYAFAQGTSMSAPMAAGVAALIIEKNGGRMQPGHVRAALRQSAIDLGKPGNDEIYGHGWVNAFRAVQ